MPPEGTESAVPRVRPPVIVEEAWERKPPAKTELAVVDVASIVPVCMRSAWMPPIKEVEVEVVVATEEMAFAAEPYKS